MCESKAAKRLKFLDQMRDSVFSECITDLEQSWTPEKLKQFKYIEPAKVLKQNAGETVCASKLTYEELSLSSRHETTKDFVGVNLWKGHKKATEIKSEFIDGLWKRSQKISGNPAKFILGCKTSIAQKVGAIGFIQNEAEVRFAYADALVMMLHEAFEYSIDLEDTISESQSTVNISNKSEADYVCWVIRSHHVEVCVVVLETKHVENIKDAIAQTLGYYLKSKKEQDDSQPGVAILLNEYNGKVTIKCFLFPYEKDGSKLIQALMLPEFTYDGSFNFIKSQFVEFVYIMCMKDSKSERVEPLLRIQCPHDITPFKLDSIKGVLTLLELKDKEIQAERSLRLKAEEQVQKAKEEAKEEVQKAKEEAKEEVQKAKEEAKEEVQKAKEEAQKAKEEVQKAKQETQILREILEQQQGRK